jgi:hypothetical protein
LTSIGDADVVIAQTPLQPLPHRPNPNATIKFAHPLVAAFFSSSRTSGRRRCQIDLVRSIWSDQSSTIDIHKEAFMTAPGKNQQQKTSPVHPSRAEEAMKQKQKAEQSEVAGRHKNDGQKDHKGAR